MKINPEFEALIPPLSDAELDALRASLLKEGRALDPLIVWRGVVLDGHNRYRMCTELGLPFTTTEIDLPDEAAARQWIFEHQIARRNLMPDQIIMLAVERGLELPAHLRTHANVRRARLIKGSPQAQRVIGSKTYRLTLAENAWKRANGVEIKRAPAKRAAPAPERPPATAAREATPAEVEQAYRVKAETRNLARKNRELLAELTTAKDALEGIEQLTSAELPPIKQTEFHGGKRDATAVSPLADVHAETFVHPEDTPRHNIYTLSIAELRMARFFESVLWATNLARERFYVRNLVLPLLGDFITGTIHEENIATAQVGPNSALLFVQACIETGVRKMAANFERVDVPCQVGNHGRTSKKMGNSTAVERALEWLMYHALARVTADLPNVHWHIPRSTHGYLTIYGNDAHFHHGHELRYSGGVLGIAVPAEKATSLGWDRARKAAYNYFAHHHRQSNPTPTVIMSGSMIGYDAYAMNRCKAPFEPPQQVFDLIDSKRGRSLYLPLWVSDPEAELKLWEAERDVHEKGMQLGIGAP